jgi:hypothetical protein
MRINSSRGLVAIAALVATAAAMAIFTIVARATPQAAPASSIACRALEVQTASQFTLVIFHQRDKQDHEKVEAFLRAHSDGAAQFRSADGAWHDATLLRLKSCFGRGLLIFPAGAAKLSEKDAFTLRVAPAK